MSIKKNIFLKKFTKQRKRKKEKRKRIKTYIYDIF
jgi:hypothetical protein